MEINSATTVKWGAMGTSYAALNKVWMNFDFNGSENLVNSVLWLYCNSAVLLRTQYGWPDRVHITPDFTMFFSGDLRISLKDAAGRARERITENHAAESKEALEDIAGILEVRVLHDYSRRENHRDIGPSAAVGLGLIVARLQSHSGQQWITEALDGDLLGLILALGLTARPMRTSTPEDCFPLLKKLLRNIIPGYLVYHSVALRMKEHFPNAVSFAASPAFKKSAVFGLWKEFATQVEQNLTARDLFESKQYISYKVITSGGGREERTDAGAMYFIDNLCRVLGGIASGSGREGRTVGRAMARGKRPPATVGIAAGSEQDVGKRRRAAP
ncbi:hypothetical protein B0H14DRAFT_3462645 [Mycena olivaceomarginata]|nr:hypothetical protein B0H14DRAFT_3462645 [Mycena olivaceomarginata]